MPSSGPQAARRFLTVVALLASQELNQVHEDGQDKRGDKHSLPWKEHFYARLIVIFVLFNHPLRVLLQLALETCGRVRKKPRKQIQQ